MTNWSPVSKRKKLNTVILEWQTHVRQHHQEKTKNDDVIINIIMQWSLLCLDLTLYCFGIPLFHSVPSRVQLVSRLGHLLKYFQVQISQSLCVGWANLSVNIMPMKYTSCIRLPKCRFIHLDNNIFAWALVKLTRFGRLLFVQNSLLLLNECFLF